jgi:hypothetical protein
VEDVLSNEECIRTVRHVVLILAVEEPDSARVWRLLGEFGEERAESLVKV